MLIDWFTVGAQALNFVILVWLMRRFLYKPVLRAIDAREKKIAAQLADAAAKEADAQAARAEFQHKNDELGQQRAALIQKATEEADAERQRLLEEARSAADVLGAKRQETLRSDAHNLNQAIRRRAQQEVFAIARRALVDLAGSSLEERVTEVFMERFRRMDGPAKAMLGEAIKKAPGPATVRSAFELPAPLRAALQDVLNRAFSADVRLQFETGPELVSGIELSTDGHKVGWSIANYLDSLENGVEEVLKAGDKALAKTEPKAQAKPEAKAEPKAQAEPKPQAEPKAQDEAKSS